MNKMQNQQVILLKALLVDNNNLDTHFRYIQFLLNHQRLEQAEQQCKMVLKINENSSEGWCFLGQVNNQFQKQEQAIRCFRKALDINPNLIKANIEMGRKIQDMGQVAKFAKKALEIDPKCSDAYVLLSFVAYTNNRQDRDQQIKLLEKALQYNRKNVLAMNNLAWTLWQQNKIEAAYQWVKKGLQIEPLHPTLNMTIQTFLTDLGRFQKCQKWIKKYLKKQKQRKVVPYHNYAQFLFDRGRYKESEQYWLKCIEMKPDKALFYEWLCQTYVLQGQYKKALDCVDKVELIDAQPSLIPDMLCRIWQKIDNPQLLACLIQQRLEKHVDSPNLLISAAKIYRNQNKYQQAEECIIKYLKLQPFKHEGYQMLSTLLAEAGKYEEALIQLDKAIKYKPDVWQLYCQRGLINNKIGRYQQAIISFENSIHFNRQNYFSYIKMTEIHCRYGQIDLAFKVLQKGIQSNPENKLYLIPMILLQFKLQNYEEAIDKLKQFCKFIKSGIWRKCKQKCVISQKSLSQIFETIDQIQLSGTLNITIEQNNHEYENQLAQYQLDQTKQNLINYLDQSIEYQHNNLDIQKLKMAIDSLQKQLMTHQQSYHQFQNRLRNAENQINKYKKELQLDQEFDTLLADNINCQLYKCMYWILSSSVQAYRVAQLGILQKGNGVLKSNAGFFIDKIGKMLGVVSKISIIGDFCSFFNQLAQFYVEQEKKYVITQIVQATNSLYSEKKLSKAVCQAILFLSSCPSFLKLLKAEKQNNEVWYNKLIRKVQKARNMIFEKVTCLGSHDISDELNLAMIFCSQILLNLIQSSNKEQIKNCSNPILKAAELWSKSNGKQMQMSRQIRIKVNRAVIYENRTILGKMDPYCKVKYGNIKFKSSVHKNGNLNPVWQHQPFSFQKKPQSKQIIFKVYDSAFLKDGVIGIGKTIDDVQHLKNKGQTTISLTYEGKSVGELFVEYA